MELLSTFDLSRVVLLWITWKKWKYFFKEALFNKWTKKSCKFTFKFVFVANFLIWLGICWCLAGLFAALKTKSEILWFRYREANHHLFTCFALAQVLSSLFKVRMDGNSIWSRSQQKSKRKIIKIMRETFARVARTWAVLCQTSQI